jgi:hypothetical protein
MFRADERDFTVSANAAIASRLNAQSRSTTQGQQYSGTVKSEAQFRPGSGLLRCVDDFTQWGRERRRNVSKREELIAPPLLTTTNVGIFRFKRRALCAVKNHFSGMTAKQRL